MSAICFVAKTFCTGCIKIEVAPRSRGKTQKSAPTVRQAIKAFKHEKGSLQTRWCYWLLLEKAGIVAKWSVCSWTIAFMLVIF